MGLPQLQFGRIDSLATSDAAETMGAEIEAYCEKIGKSDLRDLTAAEWEGLLSVASRNAIATYRDALQNRLRNEAPF